MNRHRVFLLALTLVTVALVGLLLAASASADPTQPDPWPPRRNIAPIAWDPPAVTGVISPGATYVRPVSFTTSLTITHVRLEVTPPLKFFCEITPTTFLTITPGITYTVRISCTVPLSTTMPVAVRPGNMTGLIQVWGAGPHPCDHEPCPRNPDWERFWPQSLKIMLRVMRVSPTAIP
jgi:hypothetical protein